MSRNRHSRGQATVHRSGVNGLEHPRAWRWTGMTTTRGSGTVAKRNAPRINFNLVAAAIIGIVIAAGVIGLEWQPASDMAGLLQQLQQELVGERWEEAAATLQGVHAQWEKRRKWLVLNNSRNAVFRFEEQLARVRAGIGIRHRPAAVIDAEELLAVWREFAG